MILVVKDQADKAKELLKTNIEVKVGDKFKGPDKTKMQALAGAHPDVFELQLEDKDMPKQPKQPEYKAESNKLLKKTSKTKTKKTSK